MKFILKIRIHGYCERRICGTSNSYNYLIWAQMKGCNRCSIEYPDTSIRNQSKLSVPQKNTETLIAHPPTVSEDSVAIRHEPEIEGGLKALRDKGLKITHYEEHIPK